MINHVAQQQSAFLHDINWLPLPPPTKISTFLWLVKD
jgi:hypothetical protein